MKKINLNELISIGLIIVIGCFIISFAANRFFDIDSDFLSASATFFAGVVAYKLFNDWRIQYRTELLERLKDRIHNLFVNLENDYIQLHNMVVIENKMLGNAELISLINLTIDNIVNEIFFYEKIFFQYGLDEKSVCILPITVRKGLSQLSDDLMGKDIGSSDLEEYFKDLKIYLEGVEGHQKIINYKNFLNEDLQTLILDSISDKKGH
ncbi:MAG: hypothetical protein LBQ29_04090 [Acinetobacter sp.]|jgi:hypothetical protein|uniref:hypothetical protein n=1 Tax=Acinetobacter sp. TaxID=472 RepID=UPI00282B6C41|nr:hypothetical protein [Acinetobacter sp.]MDR2060562.1 hypothetical protein [Acinetobacter sp.]